MCVLIIIIKCHKSLWQKNINDWFLTKHTGKVVLRLWASGMFSGLGSIEIRNLRISRSEQNTDGRVPGHRAWKKDSGWKEQHAQTLWILSLLLGRHLGWKLLPARNMSFCTGSFITSKIHSSTLNTLTLKLSVDNSFGQEDSYLVVKLKNGLDWRRNLRIANVDHE